MAPTWSFKTFKLQYFLLAFLLCETAYGGIWNKNRVKLRFGEDATKGDGNAIEIWLGPDDNMTVGSLGVTLPESLGYASYCDESPPNGGACFEWGDYAKLEVIPEDEEKLECLGIVWKSSYARRIDDCFDISPGIHWYGGGETYSQRWPIEVQARQESPFITGDHLNNGSFFAGGVLEKHWLLSNGVAFFIQNDSPLHYSLRTESPSRVCFTSKDDHPYTIRSPLTLNYTICAGKNILEGHELIKSRFYKMPTSIPNESMLLRPLWSTWAQYHSNVNQEVVLEFARRVVSEGFGESSHIEIDDNWEPCYGQETFDEEKFPDPKAMIDEIKQMNLNVTVWVHPFVNFNCPLYDEGLRNGYFVRDVKGRSALSSWWQGSTAGTIDVTNPDAVQWWQARLRKLQQDTGVDSFKFDAGESNWLPYHSISHSPEDNHLMPNLYTTKFVEAVSVFGDLIETRTAHRNQDKGIFIRMMDKDSRWGYDNGLQSMIPTLFHFGLLGYPFVLPDMIGGNAYGGRPSKELYIRWMQANVLMPSMQISIVPWDFDDETVKITLEVLQIRKMFAAYIMAMARRATIWGDPMNKPLWWLAPEDRETFTIDHQYSLGHDVIVAPILEEGANSRDIYLPEGTWTPIDNWEDEVTGPVWLRNYSVPLTSVPIFTRMETNVVKELRKNAMTY